MLPLLANCAGIFEKQEDRSDPLINGMIKAFVAERFAVPMHSDSFMRCLYSNNVHEMVSGVHGPGRRCHSTMPFAVIGGHSSGVYIVDR